MMRRTPMPRSSFRSHGRPPEERFERVRAPLCAIRVPAPSAPIFCPSPKRVYVRSEPLLAAVRLVPYCMLCGRHFTSGEHADPAHSNWSGHGKAGSIKADDNRIAALCRIPCHAWVDASGDPWLERFDAWWASHGRTINYLTSLQLWPAHVPIPDTHTYPKELS